MARKIWTNLSPQALIGSGRLQPARLLSGCRRLIYLDNGWYVTHTGLLGLARRNRCAGIHVRPVSGSAIPHLNAGHSRLRFTIASCRASSATAMPIRPTFLPSSTVPRCAWPKLGRSTVRCARPTESASARSRRSDPSPQLASARESKKLATACQRQRELRRPNSPRSALPIDPPASTRCHSGQAVCGRLLRREDPARGHPRAGRELRRSPGRLGRERPQCPALPAQQLSRHRKKVPHETAHPGLTRADRRAAKFPTACSWSASIGPLSLGRAETVLSPPLLRSRTQRTRRALLLRPTLLHAKSAVEVQLVPARFRLRPRTARPG